MKDKLKKLSMDSMADGGEIALSGFIGTMEKLKQEVGDKSFTISQFISLAQDAKEAWKESMKDKVS